jgi:hypothetical protein
MPDKDVTKGLTFSAVAQALHVEGQPDETEWPYAPTHPNPWIPPPVSQRWFGSLVPATIDIPSIIQKLTANQPVILGIRVTSEFLAPAAPYIVPAAGKGFGGHAVLAIGLAEHAAIGPLILVRNSWGPKWGENGCGWLCADYLTDKLIGYRVISPLPPAS